MTRVAVALTALALAPTLGCGGQGRTPSPDAQPAKAEPAKAQPADAEPAKAQPAKAEPAKAEPAKAEPAKADPLAAPADVAAAPADAIKTASGLAWKLLTKGTGTERPGKRDTVKVHYTGWTADGKRFDSSVERGTPAEFPLNGVIAGWTEGLQLMVVGDKRRFWIPGELAYGDTPRRPGAPAGPLVFDVELLAITKAPTVPAPADVAAAPADAVTTDSGLKYKVLEEGTGEAKPTVDNTVTVHYTGWTTDGEMFDSSVVRKRPATFPLRGVIPGWTEGLQTMKVGGKTRFWIPGNLAYGDTPKRPGAPAGALVFDVELISFK
ncbi:MAG: peptidylprolyl isomerase [Proteobacteria bacterium]|nr:MAG: peptidylprolyl isomerase [Pseudomonadota bacterium]